VVTFGFRTHFGGGRSTGFALIYDDEASQKKFEPRFRLVRVCITSFPVGRIFIDGGLLVWIGHKEGQANAETAEGAKEPFQEGKLDLYHVLPKSRRRHPTLQFRGTKKVKAAEPPKKGK